MNDLDDDLLKELGLEPKNEVKPQGQAPVIDKPAPKAEAKTPLPNQNKPAQKPVPQQAVAPKSVAPEKTRAPEAKSAQMAEGIAAATQVQLVAVVGKKTTTLKELLQLNEGSLIDLNKLPSETIDLVANGKMVAKGQLVLIDGRVGVQIKQVFR